jgi:hypothetical protein
MPVPRKETRIACEKALQKRQNQSIPTVCVLNMLDFVLESFYFVFISLISFRFVSFLLISFRFVSFRFVFVDFVSFRFVSFLFRFAKFTQSTYIA